MRTGRVVVVALALLVTFQGQSWGSDEAGEQAVRFAVIGDRAGDPQKGIYGQILEEASRLKPEFMITVGDMIVGYTEDSVVLKERWDEFMSIVKPVACPLYYTPGNNDIQGATSGALYERYIGPPYHSFDYEGLHFAVLNNGMYAVSDELPSEQIDWLAADLAAHRDARATFVFMHLPFWYSSTALGKPDTLHTLFLANGVDAVFTGHFHNYFAGEYDGIKYTGLGSSGGGTDENRPGPGFHFGWVTVDDGIAIAPIAIGAVLPWDVVTPAQVALVSKLQQEAAAFTVPATVAENLTVAVGEVRLQINNLTTSFAWTDSLRWEIPDGWTVEPAVMALHVEPGQTAAYGFQVKSEGDLYPVPTVTFEAPYTENDTCRLEARLQIGRRAAGRLAATPPTIDGKLDETCWDRPVSRLLGNDARPVAGDSTLFYFAYDNTNLYLAARCVESDMGALVAAVTERDDPVYSDDCAGFFIQPDIGRREAYQIYVNTLRTIYDQHLYAKEDGYFTTDQAWNGEYQIATSKSDREWVVEMALPLAQFGATVQSGSEWGISFRRKQQRTALAMHFQLPWSYETETYGRLVFE